MYIKNSSLLWITILACFIAACSQKPDDFKNFLNGQELKYPGAITQTYTRSGNLRLGIGWSPSPDPSVTKYKVYWNNYKDSVEVTATTHSPSDTIFTIINNLQEYTYSFFVFSLDDKGNRSIPIEIQNARVYGMNYRQSLMNRPVNLTDAYQLLNEAGTQVQLNFLTPDTANIITYIRYTTTGDVEKEVTLAPDVNSITLNDYKFGTKVAYQSTYKPGRAALDTFITSLVDTFPSIRLGIKQCDKTLFREIKLANDVGTYESGTSVSKLWDGSVGPQGYPNIFHSDDHTNLPHHFTFDMGKAYDSLRTIEVTGRDCCHNPVEYEIWGIADVTNAATALPGNDPGWKDEAIAKGWILLKDVTRSDDGKGPYTVTFSELPRIRYIRFRVKKVASGSNNTSNLSEVTLQYQP